jgi:hypothetical protein
VQPLPGAEGVEAGLGEFVWSNTSVVDSFHVLVWVDDLVVVHDGFTADSSITIPTNGLRTYTWRIDAINEAGTTEGDDWWFRTSPVIYPQPPHSPYPADGDSSANPGTLFSWGECEEAEFYEVRMWPSDSDPEDPAYTTNREYQNEYIQLGSYYFWQVIAYNSRGSSAGPIWSFHTQGPSPYECCGQYTQGMSGNIDCDPLGRRQLVDITLLIDHLYLSKRPLCCAENANTNGDLDGEINLADITKLIAHIYTTKEPTALCW